MLELDRHAGSRIRASRDLYNHVAAPHTIAPLKALLRQSARFQQRDNLKETGEPLGGRPSANLEHFLAAGVEIVKLGGARRPGPRTGARLRPGGSSPQSGARASGFRRSMTHVGTRTFVDPHHIKTSPSTAARPIYMCRSVTVCSRFLRHDLYRGRTGGRPLTNIPIIWKSCWSAIPTSISTPFATKWQVREVCGARRLDSLPHVSGIPSDSSPVGSDW